MSSKLEQLFDLVFLGKVKKFPKDLRLFLFTKNKMLRIYYGRITGEISFSEGIGKIQSMKCERGNILDVFAKLEFIINEIIQLKLLGANSGEKGLMLDNILANVDFFSRIKLLNDWNILDSKQLNFLMQTKQVRNSFAHCWDKKEVSYKGKFIEETFEEFKKDMETIWIVLLEVYDKEQQNIDFQKIIDELNEMNK